MRGTLFPNLGIRDIIRFIPAYAGNASALCAKSRRKSVHPRVCGERSRFARFPRASSGSSPRMRGTQAGANEDAESVRFIPAYAGNAGHQNAIYRHGAVHPRVCGERHEHGFCSYPPVGSSPRMRGTHWKGLSAPSGTPVHPRVCGERKRLRRFLFFSAGSSPRMRGTPRTRSVGIQLVRFIPAYAGNAEIDQAGSDYESVHPRVCGERSNTTYHPSCCAGSSPRMRGTRSGLSVKAFWLRFIPAYAGNAHCPCMLLLYRAVHPRVCGERLATPLSTISSFGSSPRMRGTRSRGRHSPARDRFIPAYAGNAQGAITMRCMPTVHPRVCGERRRQSDSEKNLGGSSPRMRGTLTAEKGI